LKVSWLGEILRVPQDDHHSILAACVHWVVGIEHCLIEGVGEDGDPIRDAGYETLTWSSPPVVCGIYPKKFLLSLDGFVWLIPSI
jgi:hypothetical protein